MQERTVPLRRHLITALSEEKDLLSSEKKIITLHLHICPPRVWTIHTQLSQQIDLHFFYRTKKSGFAPNNVG